MDTEKVTLETETVTPETDMIPQEMPAKEPGLERAVETGKAVLSATGKTAMAAGKAAIGVTGLAVQAMGKAAGQIAGPVVEAAAEKVRTSDPLGGRPDATRVRMDGMHEFMINLYKDRTDAEVYVKQPFDVSAVMAYVAEANEKDLDLKTTPWHVFVTAIAKTIYERPLLNRFVSGGSFYDRNEVSLSFVVKRQFEDDAEEIMLVVHTDEDMTREDISRIIVGDASKLRGEHVQNDAEGVIEAYGRLPRWAQRFAADAIIKVAEYGKLPASWTKDDVHHSSVLLSNLGSIKFDAAYHHLNNFGTNSIVGTIGRIHKEPMLDDEGHEHIKDVANFAIVLDERIADGFYFAKSLKLLQEILLHPEVLDQPLGAPLPEEILDAMDR